MTRARNTGSEALIDVVTFESSSRSYVALASDIDGIHSRTESTNLAQSVAPQEGSPTPPQLEGLFKEWCFTSDESALRCCVVDCGEQKVALPTSASLDLKSLPTRSLFRLPRLLREAGCQDWVCGVALLKETNPAPDQKTFRLAIWIDPRKLGAWLLPPQTLKGKRK